MLHSVDAVVLEVDERLGIVGSCVLPARKQLGPPGEEELLNDKLEPRREGSGCENKER